MGIVLLTALPKQENSLRDMNNEKVQDSASCMYLQNSTSVFRSRPSVSTEMNSSKAEVKRSIPQLLRKAVARCDAFVP